MSDALNKISAAIIAGDVGAARTLTQQAMAAGLSPKQILDGGLVPGMDHVGGEFKSGNMFVPEVLLSARAMQEALGLLRPKFAETGTKMTGKVIVGTVKGDLHDIGKNLVGMMLEGAGFEVIDLGKDVDVDKFIKAVKEHKPDIVGLSALLTTTMTAMDRVIKALKEAGLRDEVKVLVGGAPVTHEFALKIGADAYGPNAATAVDLAKSMMHV